MTVCIVFIRAGSNMWLFLTRHKCVDCTDCTDDLVHICVFVTFVFANESPVTKLLAVIL